MNLLTLTDSYKVSHYKQYPSKSEIVYSYLESRGGEYDKTVFFGLQYIIKKYLQGKVVTREKIDEAKSVWNEHLGGSHFNTDGWEYILNVHGGVLPIKISAIPEGTVVDNKNVLVTVENTDPRCYWLTNYLETLLVQVWYPITVATQSWYMKKRILSYLAANGDVNGVDFKLHDFGFRGVSSVETAGVGSAAHLLNFSGTDTFAGVMLLRKYYDAKMPGYSIPASEHSTITSWGKENELDAMRNMLEQYPTGLVACVSDSFDIFKACEKYWGHELREKILQRDGTLVVRPDSGEPCDTVLKVMNILGEKFGYTYNDKGYKVLNPKVRVIQGDGIDPGMLNAILWTLHNDDWSADNIAFGSGGALLQKLNRDTLKFAFKCSAIRVDGKWKDVYKEPVTDPGKKSKRGRLGLFKNMSNGAYYTKEHSDDPGELVTVFKDGRLLVNETFDLIKKRTHNA